MKKIYYVLFCLFAAVLVFSVFSCDLFYKQIGKITIKNNSGQEVTDIVLFVPEFNPETDWVTHKIDSLAVNKSITVSYDIVNSKFTNTARTATSSAGIEYYINGVKFGTDIGKEYIQLIHNVEALVTINAEGWNVTLIR